MKRNWILTAAFVVAPLGGGAVWAQQAPDAAAELNALKVRVAELEAQSHENWLNKEREEQIRTIVSDVLKDAKTREGSLAGYNNGFYIQSADGAFKLTIGGFVQARYEFVQSNATNNRTLTGGAAVVGKDDPVDANGFSVRRARVSFSGSALTPDLTFKLEGDFYGGSGGAFTVTDAFVAYRFTDQVRVRAGSFKAPFAKNELTSDTSLTLMERAEVLSPFDPVRSIGVSLYGDILKDQLAYEVSINNGSKANTLKQPDATSTTANLDNRLGAYARLQWAGSGKISDFADESDLRDPKKSRDFIWLLGGAVGYESQNSAANGQPSPQTTGQAGGIGTNTGFTNYTLNGDVFRGTLDWSAKWQGLSLLTAVYFQQFNANPSQTTTTAPATTTGPFGPANSSFFQHGYYGQVGYFVIPQKLELVGRVGVLATEGYPNIAEAYTVGANYYIYGHNLKIQADMTYTPEAPYTDASAGLLQNTHDVIGRLQLQAKF